MRFWILAIAFTVICVVGNCAEFRGAWVTAWTSGFFTAEEIDNTIAAAKKAKLTALFIQVRKNGDAYYTSATEPRGDGIAADFDPLATMIKKAHAAGLQVHAWVNAVRMWSAKTPPTDPRHIVNRHPEWINKDADGAERATEGLYLDPGIPEAREYIASVIEEIAKNYKVDGIHLDYIRYPGKNWGYSEAALRNYYAATGCSTKPDPDDPKWLHWKRDQVTELVKLIRRKVKAVRPKILLSASTITWGKCPIDFRHSKPYAYVCQDWRKWLAEGLIDANCPMNYKQESNAEQAASFRKWLRGFVRWSSGKPTYVGVEVHINQTAEIMRQIDAIRRAKLGGFMLFSFNQSSRRDAIADAVGKLPARR
ncbi:MAG: family 10 glycosylhydrolase [Armatimonadetes bacterium]|nr:family 10 glycosylhydrolase [Armatimonadota bacterium]